MRRATAIRLKQTMPFATPLSPLSFLFHPHAQQAVALHPSHTRSFAVNVMTGSHSERVKLTSTAGSTRQRDELGRQQGRALFTQKKPTPASAASARPRYAPVRP